MRIFKGLCALLASALTAAAQADTITVDADGSGGMAAPQAVGSIDFTPGTALANNVIAPGGQLTVGQEFDLFYQATVASLNGPDGLPLVTPGLNTSYEISVVVGFREVVTGVGIVGSTQVATFADAPGGVNYVRLYFSPANANPLAGTGFDDGQLILEANVIAADSVFTIPNIASRALLDSFGADNWGGQQTVVGSGFFDITSDVEFSDNDFFVLPPGIFLELAFANGNLNLPFRQQNPSMLVIDDENNVAIVPALGAVNGLTGPDIIFQADGNASFTVIPEPGSLAMLGLGLFGLAGGAIRRRRAANQAA